MWDKPKTVMRTSNSGMVLQAARGQKPSSATWETCSAFCDSQGLTAQAGLSSGSLRRSPGCLSPIDRPCAVGIHWAVLPTSLKGPRTLEGATQGRKRRRMAGALAGGLGRLVCGAGFRTCPLLIHQRHGVSGGSSHSTSLQTAPSSPSRRKGTLVPSPWTPLTFLLLFLLIILIGPQQGENNSSLGVDTHSSHYHPARTFHDVGTYMERKLVLHKHPPVLGAPDAVPSR